MALFERLFQKYPPTSPFGRVDTAAERLGGQGEERVGNQEDINVPHMLNCDGTRFTHYFDMAV